MEGDAVPRGEFWSKERINILRLLLKKLLGRDKAFTVESMLHILKQQKIPAAEMPKARALRHFLTDEDRHPQADRHLGHLLRWALGVVQRNELIEIEETDEYRTAERLLQELNRVSGPEADSGARARGPQNTIISPSVIDIVQAIELVSGALNLSAPDFERLNKRLFRPGDDHQSGRRERHYMCYRYHSKPGHVVKSFLAVMGPQDHMSVPTFACFFTDQHGSTRKSGGVVLPMREATYLVGTIERDVGLKLIVVPHLEDKMGSYPGLILSMDEDFSPIGGRCVLIPTKFCRHDEITGEAETGIWPEAMLDREIEKIRPKLKNRMDFKLCGGLHYNNKPIDQETMVARVKEAFTDPETLSLRFTYAASGEPFNPADTKHYTFNGALRIWDAGDPH